MEGNDRHV